MATPHHRLPAILRHLAALGVIAAALPATAQVADTLKHTILPPPVGTQSGAGLGSSVAVDGTFIVCGVPFDDIGATDAGVVKVFDSTTGALRFVLPNPSPAMSDYFGCSVAISGTLVIVGADSDDTGASKSVEASFCLCHSEIQNHKSNTVDFCTVATSCHQSLPCNTPPSDSRPPCLS